VKERAHRIMPAARGMSGCSLKTIPIARSEAAALQYVLRERSTEDSGVEAYHPGNISALIAYPIMNF
jgi:hypothetical protein